MELPASLLAALRSVPGFDEATFLEAHNRPAQTSVRLHPLKQGGIFTQTTEVAWCSAGRYLADRPVFTLDPAYHAGAYYVQEASSMFLDYLLRQLMPMDKPLRVLDLCAAPGGKSTLIASLLRPQDLLISNEVIRARATILEENAVRWGYTNHWVTCNDPAAFGRLEGYFDVILVDAPCSGSGLFRKDEQALTNWSEANVHLCSQRQQRILADVLPALKTGGLLVYATCSYSPEEDEELLDWLLSDFSMKSAPIAVPAEWGIVPTYSPKHQAAGYRFFPGTAQGEGFFIAAATKEYDTRDAVLPRQRSQHQPKLAAQVQHLLAESAYIVLQGHEQALALHPTQESDWHFLSKQLYFRKAGLALGIPSAKEWIPVHDLALSVSLSQDVPAIPVSREQALRFLKKDDMMLDALPKGWSIVRFDGMSLGWVKGVGNRINNYLPKNWRIRMALPDEDVM